MRICEECGKELEFGATACQDCDCDNIDDFEFSSEAMYFLDV